MKYYQSYVAVNLDNLKYNFNELKKISYPAKICAVIKANAYGLGALTVAKELEANGVDYFCVANLNEALELRNEEIVTPILVLGYVKEDMHKIVVKNNIEITAYNYEQCYLLNEKAKEMNSIVNVHIKINTGMGRLGYLIDENNIESAIKEIKKISKLSNIRLNGIYSHLSDADNDNREYTKLQYEKFMSFIMYLEEEKISIPIKHISNDAGAIVHGYYLDMIRIGISMYGYYPSKAVRLLDNIKLKPVASLFSTVASIKSYEKGESIGYNRTYITNKKTKIAVITIGYADGYPIQLSNKGYVKIRGQFAEIIGKVCMDQTMIDVTEIDDIKIGDSVLLYGEDKYGEISIYDIANKSDTIVYDLLCRIGMRVPRIYIKNNKVFKIVNYLKY